MTPFRRWLHRQRARFGSFNRMAAKLGIASSSMNAWALGRALPDAPHQIKLAEATGEPIEQIKELVWESDLLRWRQRRRPRGGPSKGVLPGSVVPAVA